MSMPTFTVGAVTNKDEYDALLNLVCEFYASIPEDAPILQKTIIAMKNYTQSLMGVGRINDDPCSFFILGLDAEPLLEVIYVPPGLRSKSLGSSLFVGMATMMSVSNLEHVSITASGRSIGFFERLGARILSPVHPGSNGECGLMFSVHELKQPEDWLKKVAPVNS